MTVKEINVQTGERTERAYTPKELSDIAAARAAQQAAIANRVVSDEELAIEHIKNTMTQAEKDAALQAIRAREAGN